jgi:copper(I)-binding protein
MPRYLSGFAAFLLYCFCCAAALAQMGAQTGGVEVTDAWARATPGGAENGSAYLTLLSPTGDRLTGVATPVAKEAQLHQMTNDGGIMRMRDVGALDLPPGQEVTLKPGGLHIMMMGLKHPLQPGQTIPLTLQFDKAGTREVSVAVGKIGAMGPETHSGAVQNMRKQPAR